MSTKAERIVDALSEAGYISDDLVTSPDRFADIVAIVDRALDTRVVDLDAKLDMRKRLAEVNERAPHLFRTIGDDNG